MNYVLACIEFVIEVKAYADHVGRTGRGIVIDVIRLFNPIGVHHLRPSCSLPGQWYASTTRPLDLALSLFIMDKNLL